MNHGFLGDPLPRRSGRRTAKSVVASLAAKAGLDLDGTGPLSVHVLRDDFYDVALARGFTGLREAYVDGA